MIDYIKGELTELTPATATLETHNIGYLINISLNTYSHLSGKANAKLYIHEAIREDAFQLYGFSEKKERDLFLLLISVSGIGASTARMVLSSLSPDEASVAIASEDVATLKTVKGIGAKTAQRIIIDLKDKVQADASGVAATMEASSPVKKEALSALVMLGFTQQASNKAVTKILKAKPTSTLEELIKQALKIL